MTDAAFLAGLLDREGPVYVAREDFDGAHGDALRRWQDLGFVGREPVANPTAACPHCDEGAAYFVGGRYLCHACRSEIHLCYLLLWPLDRERVLRHVAVALNLWGGARPVNGRLWQLGTGVTEDGPVECFYRRSGLLSDDARRRLGAYRRLLVLHGPSAPPEREPGVHVPLVELFHPEVPQSSWSRG